MYKVLLADDEPLITLGLQALLDWEDYGFEIVHTAESGEKALAYLKEHPIDLLITDIMMLEMSGLALIKEAKMIQPQMKNIVLTGYQEFDYIKEGLRLGIENYLVKPVDEDELLMSVQNVGRKLNLAAVEVAHTPDEDSVTLMDNTLWRFLNGEIERNDCLERLDLYNIQFDEPHYAISIVSFEYFQDTAMMRQVRDFIEEQYNAICLLSPHQELLVIFGGTDKQDILKKNQDLVEQFGKNEWETGSFYVTLGRTIKGIGALEESYALAREHNLMQPYLEPNVLILDGLATKRQDEIKRHQELRENLVKGLLHMNEGALDKLDVFFDTVTKESKYISTQVAKKYILDLISYIHYSIQPDELPLYTASVERMVYATNIQQLKVILQEYCQELMLTIQNQGKMRSPIVQNVLNYIHVHYDEGLSLKIMGQKFHVNAIYLGQLFQKEVGVVFSDYLNRYRLEKAKELLKTTHFRVGQIGEKVGYSDSTYFYKQFRRVVGITPSEWRKI